MEAFLAAVEAGVFGQTTVSDRSHQIAVLRGEGLMVDVFHATFSRLPPPAFSVLARMATRAVPGIARIEIHEQHKDERTLLVRGFERDTEATILDLEWEISFASTDSSCLVVRFRECPAGDVVERTARLMRIWGEVVKLGAYPPPDNGPSSATLHYVGPGAPEEIVAEFEALACAYDAFEALFEALDAIHEQQPIERVVIPYRVGGPSRVNPTVSDVASRPSRVDPSGADAHG